MINGHGGNIYALAASLGCEPSDIIDMSSNVNPIGPPPGLIDCLKAHLDTITALPEVDAEGAVAAFAIRHGIDPDRVLAGNGTTQFIYTLPRALSARKTLILGPTYADYADACHLNQVPCDFILADDSRDLIHDADAISSSIGDADLVFICNPNNPTGTLIPAPDLEQLCRSHPDTRFVIDESYLPFVKKPEMHSMIHSPFSNAIILNSMSKIFRLPGLRIGFLIARPEIISTLAPYALPWSANSLAQDAVRYLMAQTGSIDAFICNTRQLIEAEKQMFLDTFQNVSGIHFFPSVTSFLLARLSGSFTAEDVCTALARHKLLIRNCSNFRGLTNRYIRISMKTPEINRMAAERLMALLKSKQHTEGNKAAHQ